MGMKTNKTRTRRAQSAPAPGLSADSPLVKEAMAAAARVSIPVGGPVDPAVAEAIASARVVDIAVEDGPQIDLSPAEQAQLRRLVTAVEPPRHGAVNQVGVDLGPAPKVQAGAHAGFVLACQRRTI